MLIQAEYVHVVVKFFVIVRLPQFLLMGATHSLRLFLYLILLVLLLLLLLLLLCGFEMFKGGNQPPK